MMIQVCVCVCVWQCVYVQISVYVCELVIVHLCVGNPGNPGSHAPSSIVFSFLLSLSECVHVCVCVCVCLVAVLPSLSRGSNEK